MQTSPSTLRSKVECRLLAELWLQIAATFRRSGQLDQAFAAIQEAEVADAENAEVWVQVRGRYAPLFGPCADHLVFSTTLARLVPPHYGR